MAQAEGHLKEEEAEEEELEEEVEEAKVEGEGSSSLTSKQKKKKKSKAAAKLRKKLGLGGTSGEGEGQASSSSSGGKSMLSDEDVKQLQQAIVREQGPQAGALADRATLEKLMKMMNLERSATLKDHEAKQKQYRTLAEHKFWKTQPVTKPEDRVEQDGAIEPNVSRDQVRQEPYPLPGEFQWSPIDIDDDAELKEVYDLLSANYVEDIESSLRFNYSPEFLHWVLKHPGFHKEWHVGVRVKGTAKLVAFISAIPHELRVREQAYPSAEVNFLCVHKKLRSKRLTPVLIKEVTRQCHLKGVFQAIYTGGIVIPTPIACARYYHRTIDAAKLLEIGFTGIRPGMTREAFIKQYELPAEPKLAGLREIEEGDIASTAKLMRRYLRRFDMAARFTDEEVHHLLLSGKAGKGRKQVLWTYVIETEGKITDMVSFYSLPSTVLDSDSHRILEAAYLFYYATDAAEPGNSASLAVPTNLSASEQEDEMGACNWASEEKAAKRKLKERLNELIYDALILAKNQGFDVVNCLTVMDNPLFLQEQLFGPGDGFLRHYLFNWRVKPIAGGMGARPGEAELDPVVQYNKQIIQAEDGGQLTEADKIRRLTERHPRPEMGSGTGIVMV